MPFILNNVQGQLRCSNCGRIIIGQPIVVKTCCVNKPWVFCSEECYNEFLRRWVRNQEPHKGRNSLRRDVL